MADIDYIGNSGVTREDEVGEYSLSKAGTVGAGLGGASTANSELQLCLLLFSINLDQMSKTAKYACKSIVL